MAQTYRIILISAAISAALGFLAGLLGSRLVTPPVPAPSAAMRAEHFQLVDRAGRERGRFAIDESGAAQLTLSGQNVDTPAVNLAADPQGGASLTLSDDQRQRVVALASQPQGTREITLYHDGKPALELAVQKNGDPAVNLYHHGSLLITMGVTNQADPHLSFYGDSKKVALDLTSKKNGDRSLNLYGKDSTPRVVLGLKQDQKAALGLFDRKGKTRIGLMDEPSLILLKSGKVVRTLP